MCICAALTGSLHEIGSPGRRSRAGGSGRRLPVVSDTRVSRDTRARWAVRCARVTVASESMTASRAADAPSCTALFDNRGRKHWRTKHTLIGRGSVG